MTRYESLYARYGADPRVTQLATEAARAYMLDALELAEMAMATDGRERADLLTASRGAAKLAQATDKHESEIRGIRAQEQAARKVDLEDRVLQLRRRV